MGFFSKLFYGETATPTLRAVPRLNGPGKYAVEVVGESFYTDNYRRLFGAKRKADADDEVTLDVVLQLDDGNPHDARAVGVYIDGLQVGNLSREIARDFRAALARDGLTQHHRLLIGARVYMGGDDELWSTRVDLVTT